MIKWIFSMLRIRILIPNIVLIISSWSLLSLYSGDDSTSGSDNNNNSSTTYREQERTVLIYRYRQWINVDINIDNEGFYFSKIYEWGTYKLF